MNTDEKLIYMANQIAANFAPQGAARAVPATADHLAKFWGPEMRRRFLALAAEPQTKLHPVVRAAVAMLSAK